MVEVSEHPAGTFSWADLATTDVEGAKRFYGRLFGWSADEMRLGEAGTYTLFRKDGSEVAAVHALEGDPRAQDIPAPSYWLSYLSVSDVDEMVRRAREAGGEVVAEPFDVLDAGRMAVVRDTSGAEITFWQAGERIGARRVNEPGCLAWNELLTPDPERVAGFYRDLFGWETRAREMEGITYWTFVEDERARAGMMRIEQHWGPVPPYWMVYFAVEDCDDAVRVARDEGAEVLMEPSDIPVGRIAILVDPGGAPFAVVALEETRESEEVR